MRCNTLRTLRVMGWLALAVILGLSCNSRSGSGGSSQAQCSREECKLTAGDGTFGISFAAVVKHSGDRLAVGAPDDNEAASAAGAVYIYERDGDIWSLSQKLFASDPSARDRFGESLDLDGDALIVGASGKEEGGDPGAGAAYVFRHDGTSFVEEEKVLPNDGAELDRFGRGVAISGDIAVVGAPQEWDAVGDFFACLAAPQGDCTPFNSGAVYVFSFDMGSWSQVQKIKASQAFSPYFSTDFLEAGGALFGYAVATDGTSLAVGSPNKQFDPPEFDPDPDPNPGNASNFEPVDLQINAGLGYLYRFDGSTFTDEVQVFGRRDPRQCEIDDLDLFLSGETSVPVVFEGDRFGSVVDLDGDLVVFGAPFADERVNQGSGCRDNPARKDIGAAYVYRWDGVSDWVFDERLIDGDAPTANTKLGFSVGIVEGGNPRVITGAPGDQRKGLEAGAAYLYEYDAVGDEWDRAPRLHASDSAPYSNFGGSISLADDGYVVGSVGDSGTGVSSGAAYVYED